MYHVTFVEILFVHIILTEINTNITGADQFILSLRIPINTFLNNQEDKNNIFT